MRRIKKLMFLITVAVMAALVMPALLVSANETMDPDRDVSLTATLKTADTEPKIAKGAEVTLYKVAEAHVYAGAVQFELTNDYLSSGFDPYAEVTQSIIDSLAKFTEDNNIAGAALTAGDDGVVSFTGLGSGFYLAVETVTPVGFTTFAPFLYRLPYYDQTSGWVYDAVAVPKMDYMEPVTINVKKVWNDDGKSRPASISVSLSNEDGVFETVTLNEANSWKYEWTNMDPMKTWKIEEENVPSGYTVTYSSQGTSFTITNTAKLIQTGQNNWPIPVMIFAGVFFIAAGVIVRFAGTGRKADEK